jgi:hypothetical protein
VTAGAVRAESGSGRGAIWNDAASGIRPPSRSRLRLSSPLPLRSRGSANRSRVASGSAGRVARRLAPQGQPSYEPLARGSSPSPDVGVPGQRVAVRRTRPPQPQVLNLKFGRRSSAPGLGANVSPTASENFSRDVRHESVTSSRQPTDGAAAPRSAPCERCAPQRPWGDSRGQMLEADVPTATPLTIFVQPSVPPG